MFTWKRLGWWVMGSVPGIVLIFHAFEFESFTVGGKWQEREGANERMNE
jgi:hypothetical protein